jgi:signal transduction histidine kinase
MKVFTSIRWRLQLWYGLLLFAILAGFGTTAFQLEKGRQLRRLDRDLHDRLQFLMESQRPQPNRMRRDRSFHLDAEDAAWFDRARDGGYFYVVWMDGTRSPVTYSSSAPRDIPRPHPDEIEHRLRGTLRETYVFPEPGDCILVGRDLYSEFSGLRQLGWGLLGAGALVLVVGLTTGGWLVARALRPIDDIATAAGRIATGDLTQRIIISETESELGRLTMILNSTFARLDAAFSQQARFTADAAHELRTPISVLLSHSQNGLSCPCPVAEHHDAFAASKRAAQRMRRLVEDLLELARLDSGQEKFQSEPVDLATIVADAMELLQPLAADRHVTLHPNLNSAITTGDAGRLGQVATNLITNAIVHHHKTGGEVQVTTKTEGAFACITVSDNGPGIPAEAVPHLFERFFRVDSSRGRSTGGTGLGLAICKAIIDAHHGTIEVQSEPNAGARFTVRLPAGGPTLK